jgi:sporulation protein YlmC with PRC-barrel domain
LLSLSFRVQQTRQKQMKLATTLLTVSLLSAGSAFAQTATPAAAPEPTTTTKELFTPPAGTDAGTVGSIQPKDGQILASSFVGETVYESEKADAATVGKVSDLVLAPDGKIEAIVVGVGGFLGVGEKDVTVSPDQLKAAVRSDGKTWLIMKASKDQLNAAPAFDRSKLADAASGVTGAGSGAPASPAPAQ